MMDSAARAAARLVALLVAGLALMLVWTGTARAEFGLKEFGVRYHTPVTGPAIFDPVAPAPLATYPQVTQAGAHADFTTDLRFRAAFDAGAGYDLPEEQVKDVVVDLPAGFYGDPQAVPQCTNETFIEREGLCPPESQVGMAYVQINPDPTQPEGHFPAPIYNMVPAQDELAVLAFAVLGVPVKITISTRSDSDYGLRATITNVNQALPIYSTRLTLWGVPADPAHDPERWIAPAVGAPSPLPRRPFLSSPARCGEPLVTRIRARSWQNPDRVVEAEASQPAMTGCDRLAFDAGISVRPQDATADRPSAYDVDLTVEQSDDPDGLATPTLRKAVVTLPEGVAISPPSAGGLEACPDDRTGLGTLGDASCPEASKIGTVAITTPVLPEKLTGEVYLREPRPGNLFRLLIVARGPGIVIKLPGDVRPDERTGQITAVFDNNPQLPFSLLELRFKGGERAPLVNPQTCGEKTTRTELASWGGPVARPESSFVVHGCASVFAPTLEAGTANPLAGAFSPFTLTVRRPAGQPDIRTLSVDMPSGLLGMVAGVPLCPEQQAASGACGRGSRIGTATVQAGSGGQPYPLTGDVYLGGRYKGAPFNLIVVVRAVAGPFDLGTVVVRAPVHVDANRAKLEVPSDPLPTILEGVPIRLQTINVTIDRPRFMFNATSCEPMQIGAVIGSTGGINHGVTVPYKAQNCAALPLKPKLRLVLTDPTQTTDGKHPGIRARLTQTPGEAGLKQVAVKLPLSLALDPDNAQALCTPQQAEQRACPESSIIGRATAVTPALNEPLTGPVYFVEGVRRTASGQTRRTLPNLWLKLHGEVDLDLWASSDVIDDHLVTTFSQVPDAPITSFELALDGGRNGVLVVSNANLCEKVQVTQATFDGQNGKRFRDQVRMATPCGFKVAKTTRRGRTMMELAVSGLGRGKLTVTGRGVRKSTRTIHSASVARIMAQLTVNGRRELARRGRVRTRLTVTFTPAGGKARKITKTVTFRR